MSIGQVGAVGASGAIFGLLGCLLYFGDYYRLYLGTVLLSQVVPVIVLNLVLGFIIPGISNSGHVGGLIGGLFISMALGVSKKDQKNRINGIIISLIYLLFLGYMVFFK